MSIKKIDEFLEKVLEFDKKITVAEFGKMVKELRNG